MSCLVAAQNAVSWQQRGVVTASSQFFRSISGTVGVGALGAVLNASLLTALPTLHGAKLNANGLLNREVRASLSPATLHAAQSALADGLHRVFVLMALLAGFAFLRIMQIVARSAEAASTEAASVEAHQPHTAAEPCEESVALALAE
jgi:hypothetical protein